VRVGGLGFRAAADVASLREALHLAGGAVGLSALDALATAEDKATTPALAALAAELGLPIIAVPLAHLVSQIATPSPNVPARYGAHSLAEAAALAGAGPGARLTTGRTVASNNMAAAAIAENTKP
jgi:cobalt-precorrin 5A hydrolase